MWVSEYECVFVYIYISMYVTMCLLVSVCVCVCMLAHFTRKMSHYQYCCWKRTNVKNIHAVWSWHMAYYCMSVILCQSVGTCLIKQKYSLQCIPWKVLPTHTSHWGTWPGCCPSLAWCLCQETSESGNHSQWDLNLIQPWVQINSFLSQNNKKHYTKTKNS